MPFTGDPRVEIEAACPIPPDTEKSVANKEEALVIDSENNTSRLLLFRTLTEARVGASVSGLDARTEFLLPGVPPSGFTDDVQFEEPAQGFAGSIISKDQPPAALTGSLYHWSEYVTE
jgi:hypothetical protein